MDFELLHWLEDLSHYLRAFGKRTLDRLPRGGTNYMDDSYKRRTRSLVEILHPDRMALRVTEVIDETPSAKTFRFERTDGPLPIFRPGQYVNLFVQINGVATSRPYSISSPPGAPYLDLTVRRMEGGFVSAHLLDEVKAGDAFSSTGPNGWFFHETPSAHRIPSP